MHGTVSLRDLNVELAEFSALERLGFGQWIYSAVPSYHGHQFPQLNRISSYPEGFIDAYNQYGFAHVDPFTPYWIKHRFAATYRTVRRSVTLSPRQSELMSLNADYQVNKGIVFPLENVIGFKGVLALSFEGSLTELDCYLKTVRPQLEHISRAVNQQILSRHGHFFISDQCVPVLTEQQRKVVTLLAKGMLTKQIADILSISLNAVDKHIANLKVRLSARTTAEAVALALRWQLI
jgi:DNA-binding CsgD family transcriptional regulator